MSVMGAHDFCLALIHIFGVIYVGTLHKCKFCLSLASGRFDKASVLSLQDSYEK